MRFLSALCLTVPWLLGQGCSSSNIIAPTVEEIEQVRRGMNRAQVLNLLGLPNAVEERGDEGAGVTWVWIYWFQAYTSVTLAAPGMPTPIRSSPSPDRDSARIVWAPEGTVAEVQLLRERK